MKRTASIKATELEEQLAAYFQCHGIGVVNGSIEASLAPGATFHHAYTYQSQKGGGTIL